MTAAVHAFCEDRAAAGRLAAALRVPLRMIELHTLPDGESLPRVVTGGAVALLYRALDRPDEKVIPLLLAADALRRAGARRVVLVAPYLPYLRQDAVFAPGQPLSRDVLGRVLGAAFDRVVTVEPHLHRTADLTPVFGGTPVTALSAAELVAAHVGVRGDPLIAGPDAESAPWIGRIAERLGASSLVAAKRRDGDRAVGIEFPKGAAVAGRRVVLVDDILSTGATLACAIGELRAAGARTIEVVAIHDLSRRGGPAGLRRAGADSVISTDSCGHRSNVIRLAPLLATALSPETDQ